MRNVRASSLLLLWLVTSGCSPVLDWRELRDLGARVSVSLPCRPAIVKREPVIAGLAQPMSLQVCEAQQTTWAVGVVHPVKGIDSAQVQAALLAAAAANLQAADDRREKDWRPRGWRPGTQSRQLELKGRLPNGQSVRAWVGVVALEAGVVQLTAVGQAPDPAAISAFSESVRIQD